MLGSVELSQIQAAFFRRSAVIVRSSSSAIVEPTIKDPDEYWLGNLFVTKFVAAWGLFPSNFLLLFHLWKGWFMEDDLEKMIADLLARAAVEKSRRKLRALNDEIERLMDELEKRKAPKAS
jgi:hypothetical protein